MTAPGPGAALSFAGAPGPFVCGQDMHSPHTTAIPIEAMPPTRIDHRAPRTWPTHPISGEPTGVAPRNTSEYRDMTRPRFSSSVWVWMYALALVFVVSMKRPVGTESAANHQ